MSDPIWRTEKLELENASLRRELAASTKDAQLERIAEALEKISVSIDYFTSAFLSRQQQ